MQGQRGSIGSLPENLVFDHGSSSSGAGIDQQICWNNMRDSPQNLADSVLSPSETNIRFINSSSQERQSLNGWIVEPSSSVQNQDGHNEIKMENGWSSSTSACAGAGPVAEEQQNEAINILSLDNVNVALGDARIANGPLFQQTSSLSSTHGVNINPGFAAHGLGDCLPMECPSASEDMQIPSAGSSSGQFGMPSGSGGYLMEENDCRRDCSLEGRRSSCKRKTLEGNVGQSSSSGSSNYLHPEGGLWHAALPQCNIGSSSSMSAPSGNNPGGNTLEQVNDRLGIGVGVAAFETPVSLSAVRSTGSSRRNFRLRINASHQQESIYDNVLPTGSAIEHSSGSAPRHFPIGSAVENSSGSSSRLFPINSSRETGSAPAADDTIPQVQPVVVRIPPLQRSLQTSRWSGRSSSHPGSSLASVISGERDAAPDEDSNSRSMLRNISDHPLFVPPIGTRSSVHNPTNWSSTGGTTGSVRNVASTSRTGSSSGFHPSSAPNWIPHRSPPRYPRRLSELVRRSLLSSAGSGSESGGQSSNYSTQHSGPSASSQEMALPSDAGQGHNLTPSRSAMLLERQLEGAFGIPFSLQTLAAASEGRSRLVSEIRNVLDLMRRGEGLRFEDVMILDQSVFFGMADVHDRHRDMRLDIDNMSYEELLALEERIGDVCTGLSGETILKRLKQRKYRCIATGDGIQSEPCCICQEEYNNGEDLGILDCGHDFHAECIKQWLMHKNLCPVCKMAGLSKT